MCLYNSTSVSSLQRKMANQTFVWYRGVEEHPTIQWVKRLSTESTSFTSCTFLTKIHCPLLHFGHLHAYPCLMSLSTYTDGRNIRKLQPIYCLHRAQSPDDWLSSFSQNLLTLFVLIALVSKERRPELHFPYKPPVSPNTCTHLVLMQVEWFWASFTRFIAFQCFLSPAIFELVCLVSLPLWNITALCHSINKLCLTYASSNYQKYGIRLISTDHAVL